MSVFTYGIRVNKLFKNDGATAYFTPSEIVSSIVNLMEARKHLTQEEYFFVSVVFETYRGFKEKLLLSKSGYIELCSDIAAHLDLIAPYYKFCGDRRMEILILDEDDKYEYRQAAKRILKKKEIFREEWMRLHQEFLEEFYSFLK